ncbi:hypothetical protein CI109_107308 [Kwoniella shandongensis]|uniref:Mannosyltransferase n=1 Tax=Kwoniella shandongensis TaxID=1734106 RepID=A0AAJ8LT97_9TREE
MVPGPLLVSLIVRSLHVLPLPHTYFQPDEFYQAFEPAHRHVFGYGFVTWEWKDLPVVGGETWWNQLVVGGRMRSWIWPSAFVGLYKLLQLLGLDQTGLITFAPRLIGVLVACLTDLYTYRLSSKLLGPGSTAAALFLSLTSLFNAHLLPRALSTSPETLLTIMALYYFPLPKTHSLSTSVNYENSQAAALKEVKVRPEHPNAIELNKSSSSVTKLNYIVMDRISPSVFSETNAGLASAIKATAIATISGAATVGASTALDYLMTGRLYFPALTFVHQNVLRNISSFYGSTNQLYHLTQSLPILLFPLWWWWAQGFLASLIPDKMLPKRLASLDRPEGLRLLARAIAFSIATLSLSPHSEWRFLHPFLPSLLLFSIPAFAASYVPTVYGAYRIRWSFRQFTRIPSRPFHLALLAPFIPYLYLNTLHGKAQVQVMEALRRGDVGTVSSLVSLTPCHSTPWMSALHTDVDGWFLTCEPPLGQSYPSHIILFGEVLSRQEVIDGNDTSFKEELHRLGYSQAWYGWNGFDMLQDEAERRGGVHVWRRNNGTEAAT